MQTYSSNEMRQSFSKKWGWIMSKSKTSSSAKWFLLSAILIVTIGVFKVNFELAEVVKPSSSFEVTVDKDPLLLTLKAGDFKIKFSGGRFESFFNGIDTIVETIF